jgi:uncharacterized protein
MHEKKPFYAPGIRFACQGDGRCCRSHGRHVYVYVTFGDRKRLAAHLGITMHEFTRTYTRASDGMVHLKDPQGDCPFFRDDRCVVHPARPRQCRTWPFWKENMHPAVWERDVLSFCPGVGQGRLYSQAEIERIMEKRGEVGGCATTDRETRGHGDAETSNEKHL